MNVARLCSPVLGLPLLLLAGCGANSIPTHPTPASCEVSPNFEYAYALTGYAVSTFSVNSCTGQFTPAGSGSVSTGYVFPQDNSEQMVVDPLGRFAYVANLVSNVSGPSSISMYTINSSTGALTPTTPATVATGWLPQGIAIDPKGRFVYTANTDDSTVSMFTINQTTGVLTPTSPASVSTLLPGQLISDPGFLTVDPTGSFLYVTHSDSDGATVSMYTINQTTGMLTSTSPATVQTGGIPFQVVVSPNDKFAYVANNLAGNAKTDGVWEYTVDATTGVLTPTTSIATTAGASPVAVAVDPTSTFAYVVNRNDNTVSMYTINPTTGDLTLITSTTNPAGTIATGAEPFRADFDPSGQFLYVTNEQGPASIYTVNKDGTLTNTGSTGVATGALSTAFTKANQ